MGNELWLFAFRNLKNRRLRSWLTMIGIFVGVAALVALVSLGQGLQNSISQEFDAIGLNKIIIVPGTSLLEFGIAASPLTETDAKVIKEVNGVDLVAEYMSKISLIEYNNIAANVWVTGLPLDETKEVFYEMNSFTVISGRNLEKGDTHKALIGASIADGTVFDRKVKTGDTIRVNGEKVTAVGILDYIGNPEDDSAIYLPLDYARELFSAPKEITSFIVQTKKGFDAASVSLIIKEKLRRERDLKEGEEDFSVQTTQQIKDSFNAIFATVQTVIAALAGISLLVGGIGITNTMYTSVIERRKEIGIMKAIGASNKEVGTIFVVESGTLGLVGGIIGVVFGLGFSFLLSTFGQQQLQVDYIGSSFSPTLVLLALLFSFAVGALSGLLPALQAAKVKPADSLRYE